MDECHRSAIDFVSQMKTLRAHDASLTIRGNPVFIFTHIDQCYEATDQLFIFCCKKCTSFARLDITTKSLSVSPHTCDKLWEGLPSVFSHIVEDYTNQGMDKEAILSMIYESDLPSILPLSQRSLIIGI